MFGLLRNGCIHIYMQEGSKEAHSLLECADLEVTVNMSHLINTAAACGERTLAGTALLSTELAQHGRSTD